ncbi:MAG: SPASM domain-containing protein [Planctomycetota bacterium]|jgi:radical SAM protein with 4Fe4S-binding SPASM domain
MSSDLLNEIAMQTPPDIVVQYHWNGEPLLYPYLSEAFSLFHNNIRCLDTNAILLNERANDIIGNLETITISVIEKDPEAESQFETVCKFLEKKGGGKPFMVYRLLGKVENPERWETLPGVVARRILHSPEGSFNYEKKVTVPEIGICLDLLTHLAIDRKGSVSPCVRFDPHRYGRIGNIQNDSMEGIWYGGERKYRIECHIMNRRHLNPLCKACDYWGCPTGGE